MIDLLLDLIFGFVATVMDPSIGVHIPPSAIEYLNKALEYLSFGMVVLSVYVDVPYLMSLFLIIIYVEGVIISYRLAMWILKKIPLLGIK